MHEEKEHQTGQRTLIDRVAGLGMEVTVVLILALMFGLTIHALSRYLFSKSLLWFMEVGSYMFLAIVFFALASTQLLDRHIKVDIVTCHLSKRTVGRLNGIFVPAMSLIYVLFFLYGSALFTWRFYSQNAFCTELDMVPLFIPALIIPLGLLLLSIVLVLTIVRYLRQSFSTRGAQPGAASERETPTDAQWQ